MSVKQRELLLARLTPSQRELLAQLSEVFTDAWIRAIQPVYDAKINLLLVGGEGCGEPCAIYHFEEGEPKRIAQSDSKIGPGTWYIPVTTIVLDENWNWALFDKEAKRWFDEYR